MKKILTIFQKMSIVQQILIGLILGILLGLTIPNMGLSILGKIFVAALKAVAPILVFVIITAAIAQRKKGSKSSLKHVIGLYLLGTFSASLVAVCFSFLFPTSINLVSGQDSGLTPMSSLGGVLGNLALNIFANPITALSEGNYIGILTWASLLGFTLHNARPSTKEFLIDISNAVSQIIRYVIHLAPLGIMGLVYQSVTESGLASLLNYGQLLLVLVGCMLFIALVVNPIIVACTIRQNPYPLVFRCLRQSGITAFFTRSSAANIPVNMTLCQEMGLKKNVYSISIPLGATINMAGAAVTISVLTLAAVNTLGISVNIGTALLLSLLAAVSACGASGVAGGSLLLIPLAASLFGIPNDVAMQVVGVGFIIGVVQDSCETALNSSTDALFTISADWAQKRKLGMSNSIPSQETQGA